MKTKTILLTGGTGTLGKVLLQDLQKNKVKIILLIRAKTQDEAEKRAKNIIKPKNDINMIKILNSDLTKEDLGLSDKDLNLLRKEITHIIHAAASTRFDLSLSEARRNNVLTTRNLLNFAISCGHLERFGFVSSAFVAGKKKGLIKETEFNHSQGFLNTYERSKYEAESLVRKYNKKLRLVIFRPSLIITPYKKSGLSPVNALTFGIFLAKKGFLPIIPGHPKDRLDIITVNIVSSTIVQLLLKGELSFSTYHISSYLNSPYISEIVSLVEDQAKKKLTIKYCGDIDNFSAELKKISRLRPDLALIYKKVQTFLPELGYPKTYDNSCLLQELHLKKFSPNPIDSVKELVK